MAAQACNDRESHSRRASIKGDSADARFECRWLLLRVGYNLTLCREAVGSAEWVDVVLHAMLERSYAW